eukprot:m.3042 g.3042  ORF g.3042 m.3042 type:complete len:90 (-) comp2648_c0_seq2:1339-1608(-)
MNRMHLHAHIDLHINLAYIDYTASKMALSEKHLLWALNNATLLLFVWLIISSFVHSLSISRFIRELTYQDTPMAARNWKYTTAECSFFP